MYTQNFSEYAALLAKIDPAANNGEKNTGYVSLANYARAVVIVQAGALSANLDIDMEEATDTSGSDAQALDGGGKDMALTMVDDNNSVSVIEIRAEELDVVDGFHCINVEATSSEADYYSIQVWGLEPRYRPVPTDNLNTIVN